METENEKEENQETSSEMRVGNSGATFHYLWPEATTRPLEEQKVVFSLSNQLSVRRKGKWHISNGKLRANSQRLSRLNLSDGVSWQKCRAYLGSEGQAPWVNFLDGNAILFSTFISYSYSVWLGERWFGFKSRLSSKSTGIFRQINPPPWVYSMSS